MHTFLFLPITSSVGFGIAPPSMFPSLFALELGEAADMATVTQVKERADGPLLHSRKLRGKH